MAKHVKNATWPERCSHQNEKTRKPENEKTKTPFWRFRVFVFSCFRTTGGFPKEKKKQNVVSQCWVPQVDWLHPPIHSTPRCHRVSWIFLVTVFWLGWHIYCLLGRSWKMGIETNLEIQRTQHFLRNGLTPFQQNNWHNCPTDPLIHTFQAPSHSPDLPRKMVPLCFSTRGFPLLGPECKTSLKNQESSSCCEDSNIFRWFNIEKMLHPTFQYCIFRIYVSKRLNK